MERLTKKVDGVWTALCKYGNSPYPVVTQEIIDRLADYEDTGLTPEEVQIQKEAMERMGWFGKMFQRYAGDPRGPIGTFGNALEKFLVESCIEPARNRQVLKDVDGNMLQGEFRAMADFIERVQGWIPVEERLPEPTENPVIACDYTGVCLAWYSPTMGWQYRTGLSGVDITHWMHLPQPPKEEIL